MILAWRSLCLHLILWTYAALLSGLKIQECPRGFLSKWYQEDLVELFKHLNYGITTNLTNISKLLASNLYDFQPHYNQACGYFTKNTIRSLRLTKLSTEPSKLNRLFTIECLSRNQGLASELLTHKELFSASSFLSLPDQLVSLGNRLSKSLVRKTLLNNCKNWINGQWCQAKLTAHESNAITKLNYNKIWLFLLPSCIQKNPQLINPFVFGLFTSEAARHLLTYTLRLIRLEKPNVIYSHSTGAETIHFSPFVTNLLGLIKNKIARNQFITSSLLICQKIVNSTFISDIQAAIISGLNMYSIPSMQPGDRLLQLEILAAAIIYCTNHEQFLLETLSLFALTSRRDEIAPALFVEIVSTFAEKLLNNRKHDLYGQLQNIIDNSVKNERILDAFLSSETKTIRLLPLSLRVRLLLKYSLRQVSRSQFDLPPKLPMAEEYYYLPSMNDFHYLNLEKTKAKFLVTNENCLVPNLGQICPNDIRSFVWNAFHLIFHQLPLPRWVNLSPKFFILAMDLEDQETRNRYVNELYPQMTTMLVTKLTMIMSTFKDEVGKIMLSGWLTPMEVHKVFLRH